MLQYNTYINIYNNRVLRQNYIVGLIMCFWARPLEDKNTTKNIQQSCLSYSSLAASFVESAGLAILTTDTDGSDHSIVIEVKDPHNLASSCPAGVSPCLADGSLRVLLDGEESLLSPGRVYLGPEVEISAANLPGACRSFGFEKVRLAPMYIG